MPLPGSRPGDCEGSEVFFCFWGGGVSRGGSHVTFTDIPRGPHTLTMTLINASDLWKYVYNSFSFWLTVRYCRFRMAGFHDPHGYLVVSVYST